MIERIIYAFGINSSLYNTVKELSFLESNLPKEFTNRDVLDIGCGDGKMSLELKRILLPKSFKGIDASKFLVKNAQEKGILAMVSDAEKDVLSGDLGIMWGVLHHFENPVQTLKKLSKEFNSLIIRESIDDKRIFELGHRFGLGELMNVIKKAQLELVKVVEVKDNKSVILFIRNKF